MKKNVLVTGISVGDEIGSGKVKILNSHEGVSDDDLNNFNKGDILVTDITDPDWEPVMKIASAIITNKGGRVCHAAIVARELGIPAGENKQIVASIGRYGPYIKCGSKNRKISEPDNILSLTIDRAIELINQDASATAVLKELGEHDGKKIIVKNGRYGIYVTNGKINVTLPKDNDYNILDLDTAINMIKNKKPKKKIFKRK